MAEIRSYNVDVVVEKVKKYPPFATRSAEEQRKLASELSDRGQMFNRFSCLMESVGGAIESITKDDATAYTHSLEYSMAHQSAKHGMAIVGHLPVKLFLSRLQDVNIPKPSITCKLSEFFFAFGALHAGLIVGDVRVEWGKDSLVDPQWEDPALMEEDFVAHIHPQGDWALTVAKDNKKFSLANRERRIEDKIALVLKSAQEKHQLISNLVEVVVKYNRGKHYNLTSCNCQHFVVDAMKALGINDMPVFSGQLNEYLQKLKKKNKVDIPRGFDDHATIDAYVKEKLPTNTLTQHDMEYLLLHYHRIHINSIPDDADDEWECEVPSCQYECLADKVDRQAMVCHQFLTQRAHKPVRERTVRPTTLHAISEESAILSPTNGQPAGQTLNKTNGANPNGNLQDDFEFANNLSTDDQHEALQKYFTKGYYSRVSAKLRSLDEHRQKSEDEIHELVEVLTNVESFREKYSCFQAVVEEPSERHMLDASLDRDLIDKSQLHLKQATEKVTERYKEVTKFPVKLVLSIKPGSVQSTSGSVAQAPLHIAISIADFLFEWNESSLVVPRNANEAKKPALTTGVLYDSDWFTYVVSQQSKLDDTIASPPDCLHDREIEFMIQLTTKKDDIIKSFITTIIDYNKNKMYDCRTCNNRHFVQDLAKALGVRRLPAFGASLKEQLDKSRKKCSRRLSRADLSSHSKLDTYVSELKEDELCELTVPELEYLVGKYFHHHIESFEASAAPDQWSCQEANCQLGKIEEQLERTALSGQSSCVLL